MGLTMSQQLTHSATLLNPRFHKQGALLAHLPTEGQRDALFAWLLDAVREEWDVDLRPLDAPAEAAAKSCGVESHPAERHAEPRAAESCAASAGAAEALAPGCGPSLGLT